MKERLQNSTSYPTCFLMVSSTDHVTPVTGLSPTVVISKNGGAFASPSGAVSEIANGWYAIAGNASDRDTLGELLIHATGTGADPVDDRYMIVAYDPFDSVRLGLTALPPADADAPGGIPISDAGGLDLDAIKVKTDALPSGIKKGIAINNFMIYMKSSTDHISGATGLSVSGQIAGDSGSFASLTGTITEVAYGLYRINTITTSETNFDIFTLRFTATGADPAIYEFKTIS